MHLCISKLHLGSRSSTHLIVPGSSFPNCWGCIPPIDRSCKRCIPRRSLLLATRWSSTLVPVPRPRNLATMVSIAICIQCTLIIAGKCLFTVSSDWASFEYLCNAPTTRKRWDLLYLLYLAQDEIRHRLPGFQAHWPFYHPKLNPHFLWILDHHPLPKPT